PGRLPERLRRVLPGGAHGLVRRDGVAGDPARPGEEHPRHLLRGTAAHPRGGVLRAAVPVVAERVHHRVELPRDRRVHILAAVLRALTQRLGGIDYSVRTTARGWTRAVFRQ